MTGWKKNIVSVLKIGAWCAVGAGTIVILNAAMHQKNNELCTGYQIRIDGAEERIFMDEKKIEALIFSGSSPLNRPVADIDLKLMEKKLRSNVWVKDAQLFFDNDQKLQVRVHEREPIARVFTVNGNSFYIDSSATRLPLSENQAAHILVFTNFPEKGRLTRMDSLLLRQMVDITVYVNKDAFWSAQLQQVDVTSNKKFELIPLVGNHVVWFGSGENVEDKFRRLRVFYQQVISATGFDYYERLDVQYAGQVVATRKTAALSKRDSILAVQKVKQLIAESQQMKDTLMQERVRPLEKLEVSEQTLINYDLLPMKTDTALTETPRNPVPVKTFSRKDSTQNMMKQPLKEENKKEDKPKAVMQKRGF